MFLEKIKQYTTLMIVLLVWTVLITGSVTWSASEIRKDILNFAAVEGNANFSKHKDENTRETSALNIPLTAYHELTTSSEKILLISHGIIWALGTFGIVFYGQISAQRRTERKLRDQKKDETAKALKMYANAFQNSGEWSNMRSWYTMVCGSCSCAKLWTPS